MTGEFAWIYGPLNAKMNNETSIEATIGDIMD
jgi:hypothetical protein